MNMPFYLTHPDFDEIVSVNALTGQLKIIQDERLDFGYFLSVQVGQELYCILCRNDCLIHLSKLKSETGNFTSVE